MAKPVVIVVGADKGGVGKTTVSRTLLDYFSANNVQTRAFDTESPRGTLKRFHPDITEIVAATATPAIVVTHDHDEAATMGDGVVVMREGEVVAADTATRVWRYPRDEWTARFLGWEHLLPADHVQTGAVADLASHPFDILARLRFRVTVNTDNRLMGDTTMSRECLLLAEQFGYGWSDFERFAVNAMKSAFVPFNKRMELIDNVIKPGFAVLKG